jgi:hypothetical protein
MARTNLGNLGVRAFGKIRIEAVVDHLLLGGSDEVEMITHFAVKGTDAMVFSQAS